MEIKIKKSEFLNGLYIAQNVADRKSTTPAVANVLLRSDGKNSIICAATDLRISVVAELKAEVIKEGGISLGAKNLYEIVKSLPGDEARLIKKENNWAEILAGKAKYKVVGMADRDFPRLPNHREVEFIEVNAATLTEMISKTIFSVSNDDTRHHLSGIYFECDGKKALMVSTDGHRLCKIEREIGKGPKLPQGVIIPRKGVMEIRRLIEGLEGNCDVGFLKGNIFIKAKDIVLTVALVDAQFPPFDQVIPKGNEKIVNIGRVFFLESLKRVAIMSSEKNWGIRMELSKGCLCIKSDNPDLGEAREDIEIDYKGSDLSVGFNARYFIDVLSEMDSDKITLELNGELDPGLVRPYESDDYIGVVMPMRI